MDEDLPETTDDSDFARDEFIDEAQEWDSSGSSDDEVEDGGDVGGEEVTGGAGYSHVNQSRVTRSGRRVMAAKHFMYDTG